MQIRLKIVNFINLDFADLLLTKSVHRPHNEEAPVGGHEAGGQGEACPGVELQLK